jgi:CBS domain-containing protein
MTHVAKIWGGNVLSAVTVREAMRKQVVRSRPEEDTARCIARMIKYKAGAVLVEDGSGTCRGVVSKTDVVGMYYAGLPLDTPLGELAGGEPVCCGAGDRLEAALQSMLEHGVRRVYVREERDGPVAGVVGYADIVGLLYRYCNRCGRNIFRSAAEDGSEPEWLAVADVMHRGVTGCSVFDSLQLAMETLLESGVGAVAVFGSDGTSPRGVVSMTDMVLAYRHGVQPGSGVDRVMSAPVLSCDRSEHLSSALRTMIYADVQRIFVRESGQEQLAGVLSLTDAARARSGSCKACQAARLQS